MAIIQTTAALNLLPDGVNKNSTQPQMTTERLELGVYQIGGVISLASEGWRTTIKKDDNGDPSISLATEANETGVLVRTYERGTTTPTDIIGALTLRFDVEVEVPDVEPVAEEPAA
ncbi:hypothetical protein ACFQ45_13160 [Rhodanobacter aciditrophus]|uniref:Phage tail protein C-terminal domain-containing protein n=1 Tax=Rhodanobacter aciditrophus TaxID=1623218 RepID=A0ABW4B333_9GAMM